MKKFLLLAPLMLIAVTPSMSCNPCTKSIATVVTIQSMASESRHLLGRAREVTAALKLAPEQANELAGLFAKADSALLAIDSLMASTKDLCQSPMDPKAVFSAFSELWGLIRVFIPSVAVSNQPGAAMVKMVQDPACYTSK